GVVELDIEGDGLAHKCTLCYDRLKGGFEPACAKACPTDSIKFGRVSELQRSAEQRVGRLHALGVNNAYLYGTPGAPGATGGIEDLRAFFLLTAEPEAVNLPSRPTLPSTRVKPGLLAGLGTIAAVAAAALLTFKR